MTSEQPDSKEREVAQASDIEQQHGRAGNSRDAQQGLAEDQPPESSELTGSSGHIPRAETARPADHDRAASPGADSDRQAAEGKQD